MPEPGVAKGAAGSRKEVDLNVLAAQFDKELLRQRQFGAVWGELVEGGCPKTLDEAIALKKAQMADLKEKTGVQSAQAAVYTTQMQRDFPPRTGASQLGDLVRAGTAPPRSRTRVSAASARRRLTAPPTPAGDGPRQGLQGAARGHRGEARVKIW